MISEKARKQGTKLKRQGKRGLIRLVFSRIGVITLLILFEAFIMIAMVYKLHDYFPNFYGLELIFTIGMVFYLLNIDMNPSAKITWLILIMISPFLGAFLLAYTKSEIGHRALRSRVEKIAQSTSYLVPQDTEIMDTLKEEKPEISSLATYINKNGCYPVYNNTEVTYFPSGETKFEELLKQIRKAKHFIFIEYFIIDKGRMWDEILELLVEKIEEGVEVRVMYDGTCEYTTLPTGYPQKLAKLGIKCKVFSPARPFVTTYYNYRDHRKIFVIDGHTVFNGGINLADEYINEIKRHGHWKDTAVMLKGEAVRSFTLMFLQMWNIAEKTEDYEKYLDVDFFAHEQKGYVIPYGDCPLDNDMVGERVYMDILNRANKYVHIMTPYLILDGELETAIKFAAERGVDVSIILPGIPDKKSAYALAKTHYKSLLKSGVNIYEYTPGFVHAKVCVCDDKSAVVGTINLDYRSLYHHFECGTYMYDVDCIGEIEADFEETLKKCKKVSMETVKHEKLSMKINGILLKAIAPLL